VDAVVIWLQGELPLWRQDTERVSNREGEGEWRKRATTDESKIKLIAASKVARG
jgi:hypothetical protein